MSEIASFDIGPYVECDMCGEVLTDDPRSGGYIWTGKGVGPCCAERVMVTIERYGEQEYIQGRCPDGMSFADWVRQVRAQTPGGSTVRVFRGFLDGES
jgi:hypothetical protein